MSNPTDFTNFANERPNYFPGQYLLEDDFELQHKYLSYRQRYYNQSLHISGIIEGLKVEVDTNSKSVKITSGSAIDKDGNLIILKQESTFSDFKGITDGELYIQYDEKKQNQQQKDVVDSNTRWVENPKIGFAVTTPANCVKLAKLTIKDNTITPDTILREYSGLSLPNSSGQALTLRSAGNTNPNLAVLTGSLKIEGDLTVNGNFQCSNGVVTNVLAIGDTPFTVNTGGNREWMTKGMKIFWDSDNLFIGLKNEADNRKDAIIAWGDDQQDNLRFIYAGSGGAVSGTEVMKLTPDGNLNVNGNLSVSGRISGKIDAPNITSGVLDVARIPNLSADKITSGTITGDLNVQGNQLIQGSLTVNGSAQLGGFSDVDQDEWPKVTWYRDTSKNWDEGLIKHGSSKGVFKKAGYGIHFDQTREFGLWSTGWDALFAVEGHTGNTYVKGNLKVAGTIYVAGNPIAYENYEIYLRGSGLDSPEGNITFLKIANIDMGMPMNRGLNTVILSPNGTFKNKINHDVWSDKLFWNHWATWVNTNAAVGDIVAVATFDSTNNDGVPIGGSAETLLRSINARRAFQILQFRIPYTLLFIQGQPRCIEVSQSRTGNNAHLKTTYYQLLTLQYITQQEP